MMFLDCPAYMDQDGAMRCGLPAEVSRRFIMNSTDGPLESVMIRCPAGHWFNGPVEFLTWDRTDNHDAGTAAAASGAGREGVTGRDDAPGRGASDHPVGALAAVDGVPDRRPVPERRSA